MRIPDELLKCAVFIGQAEGVDEFEYEGTGFIVGIPSVAAPGCKYHFLVTAKHSIVSIPPDRIGFICNGTSSGPEFVRTGNPWYTHPTDPSADVVVMPIILDGRLDVLAIPDYYFLDSDVMKAKRMGIGDEVFLLGLFSFAPGTKKAMPIVRHGNIAMLPDEQIQVDSGFEDAYLIEIRSIGGLSGSPVFARQTLSIHGEDHNGNPQVIRGVGDYYFLGMARSHWDIKESEINAPSAIQDRQRGVNMGIGVIVPGYKILETINQPQLKEQMDRCETSLEQRVSNARQTRE